MAKKEKNGAPKAPTGADMITRLIVEIEEEQSRLEDLLGELRDLPPLGAKPPEDVIASLREFDRTDGPRTFVPALVGALVEFVAKRDALREEYLG
jgi:hypothetical protein